VGIPILILFRSEIIPKISGLLIDLPLWVYFFVVNMFPLYEFYGLPFSRVLLSRGVAYPSHE
jgi:hypothetical protein